MECQAALLVQGCKGGNSPDAVGQGSRMTAQASCELRLLGGSGGSQLVLPSQHRWALPHPCELHHHWKEGCVVQEPLLPLS